MWIILFFMSHKLKQVHKAMLWLTNFWKISPLWWYILNRKTRWLSLSLKTKDTHNVTSSGFKDLNCWSLLTLESLKWMQLLSHIYFLQVVLVIIMSLCIYTKTIISEGQKLLYHSSVSATVLQQSFSSEGFHAFGKVFSEQFVPTWLNSQSAKK